MLENIYLPKWPALLVVGEPVTKEQAQEILVRTDQHGFDYQYAGNDRDLRHELADLVGLNINEIKLSNWSEYWQQVEEVRRKYNFLDDLYYLRNSRIVSSYIGGPHGWCDWQGHIECSNYNIGKYPSATEVYEEWLLIAQAFPFLDLRCQLLDGEISESQEPCIQVEYTIRNGNVSYETKNLNLILQPCDKDTAIENLIQRMSSPSRVSESGIGIHALSTILEELSNE